MDRNDSHTAYIEAAMNWQKFKELLGFGDQCLNGGRRVSGVCRCAQYFTGRLCENIICLNDGKPSAGNISCECPDSHIRGRFCEAIHCENGGVDGDAGYCKCPYDWYSGRWCQEYSTPWGVVLGVAVTVVIILVILFIVCRLDICQSICCRSDCETGDDGSETRGAATVIRRISWRRRDRGLRRAGAASPNEDFRPWRSPRIRDRSTISEDASACPAGADVTLLFLHPDLKPPDYTEEPPPPYEAVVRRMSHSSTRNSNPATAADRNESMGSGVAGGTGVTSV